jgi:hypothetical protein
MEANRRTIYLIVCSPIPGLLRYIQLNTMQVLQLLMSQIDFECTLKSE